MTSSRPIRISGSSPPIIVLDHSNSFFRSSCSTPSSSASIWIGSSAATFETNSHSPRPAMDSRISTHRVRISGINAFNRPGANPGATIRRCCVCVGGSIMIMLLPDVRIEPPPPTSSSEALSRLFRRLRISGDSSVIPPRSRSELKAFGFFEMD